jgi:hypothetical protein
MLVPWRSAHAAIVFQDDFTYPDGALVGQGGWRAHSAAGNKPVTVSSDAITLQMNTGSGEDVSWRWFVGRPLDSATYSSFVFRVPAGANFGTAADYFAHFRAAPPDTIVFVARVFVGPSMDAARFNLGIRAADSGTGSGPIVFWPDSLDTEHDYRVVTGYDPVSGISRLWVDPVDEASASIESGYASGVGRSVESYAFRQASPAGANFMIRIDEVTVGTTFEDVMPGATPVSSTTWGRLKILFR